MDQSSPSFFVERERERCSASGFQILHIFIRFGDICTQSGIALNLACFLPPKFFEGKPPKFWSSIYKVNMLSNMWQNFAEIGLRTSEISPKKL